MNYYKEISTQKTKTKEGFYPQMPYRQASPQGPALSSNWSAIELSERAIYYTNNNKKS